MWLFEACGFPKLWPFFESLENKDSGMLGSVFQ